MACAPYFWGGAQWDCLDQLWREESSWNHTIRSGIPQAMPAGKMAAAGADWQTNPRTQVNWGLGYIYSRADYDSDGDGHGDPLGTPRHCHAGY